MSESGEQYPQDFEPEESVKAVDPDSALEEEHHLRLAVELFSVRDVQVSANVYLIYSYPLLGPKPVRTQPVGIRKNTESRVDNAYQAFEFFMTKSRLYPTLASTPLTLEVMQTDKYEKDSRLGLVKLQMEEVLRAPLKKTPQTIIRVYDEWVPILDDEERTIGSIRIKVFLEDLGVKAPGVVLAEPQSTDYQAAWELELWRRAEEAKWKATLKDKENQHLAEVTNQYQTRESEREKTFQKLISELTQQDAKLRTKATELQRREQRLVGLEEELKQKINDTGRQLAIKEEEGQSLKARITALKTSQVGEIKALNAKVEQYREELGKTEEELRRVRRDQDSAQVLQLQKDLTAKSVQISDLEKRLEAANTAKERFRQQCEVLKSNLTKAISTYQEEKKSWETREKEELTRYRLEAGAKPTIEENRELQEAKQMLALMQQNFSSSAVPQATLKPASMSNPQENTLRTPAFFAPVMTKNSVLDPQTDTRERISQERKRLIEDGYTEDDPLIKQLDAELLSLSVL